MGIHPNLVIARPSFFVIPQPHPLVIPRLDRGTQGFKLNRVIARRGKAPTKQSTPRVVQAETLLGLLRKLTLSRNDATMSVL